MGIKPPPIWTTMNAVRDYEKAVKGAMEAIKKQPLNNEELKEAVFSAKEREELVYAKNRVSQYKIPLWVVNHTHLVVAGGCWASFLSGEPIKDIDIFVLRYPHTTDVDIRDIRDEMFRQHPGIQNKTDSYNRNNDNVAEVWNTPDKKIQYIFTKHKSRKELIDDFDYVHCKASLWGDQLYITRKIYDAIKNKELIVNNDKNIQQWREEKFLERGYTKKYKTAPPAPWYSPKATSTNTLKVLPDDEPEEAPTLGDILAKALAETKAGTTINATQDTSPIPIDVLGRIYPAYSPIKRNMDDFLYKPTPAVEYVPWVDDEWSSKWNKEAADLARYILSEKKVTWQD